jgi:hypothetical protein
VAEHVMAACVSAKAAIAQSASADEIDPLDDLGSRADASWSHGCTASPIWPKGMFVAVPRQILVDVPDSTTNGSTATAVAFRAIAPRLKTFTESEQGLLSEWLDRVIAGL